VFAWESGAGAETGIDSGKAACCTQPQQAARQPALATYTYQVINVYPHDPHAFTQGLVFCDGFLYEGTGRRKYSTLRKVDLESGRTIYSHKLDDKYFGEGIAIVSDRIYQLTWRSRVGFIYDKNSFELLGKFTYPTEGWGLTSDGIHLIMSDGSASLYFYDPATFEEIKRIEVHDRAGPVTGLNELEFIRGTLYANLYPTDQILMVAPETGQATGRIDFKGLVKANRHLAPVNVLNGIAWDEDGERIFVTGKLWPNLFEVRIALRSANMLGAGQLVQAETVCPRESNCFFTSNMPDSELTR
jgi:glutamine cyclotransferase